MIPKNYIYMGIVFLFINANLVSQETASVLLSNKILTIHSDGIAFLGSGITEDDAKTIAINDAKRTALEQAGTYLESHTAVLNYQLVKDEIITYTGGLLKVNPLQFERAFINKEFAIKAKIEATIDTKILNDRISELRTDNVLKRQLEAERERNKRLEARIAELQSSGRDATKTEIKSVVNALSATEWFDKGYNTKDNNLKLEYYTKAISLDPNYSYAYINRGVAYHELGQYNRALGEYHKAIEIDPNDAISYYNRGVAYHALSQYYEAVREYNLAVSIDPNYVNAYNNRGLSYEKLGQYDAAIRDHTKALELDPQDEDAYYNRGFVYNELGDTEMAIRDYTQAIYWDPDYSSAYYNRGLAYYGLGDNENAVHDFTQAISIEPEFANAFWGRGIAYQAMGNYQLAIDDYNEYLRLRGNKDGQAEMMRQWIRNLGGSVKY